MSTSNEISPPPSRLALFLQFFYLGLTSFGGAAMVKYVQQLAVEKKKWLQESSFKVGLALVQTLPGATSLQSCAYVGLVTRGASGALAAFGGFALPAFLFILFLSVLYLQFRSLPLVIEALHGLRALIVAIVAQAAISFGKQYLRRFDQYLFALGAAALFLLNLNPLIVVLISSALGLLLPANKEKSPELSLQLPLQLRPLLIFLLCILLALIGLSLIQPHLSDLAFLMIRIDLSAFGGGFAALPLMFHEVVTQRNWLSAQIFMDGIALGQITPGPTILTSVFIGYYVDGFVGALVAGTAILLPSFALVLLVAPIFSKLQQSRLFRKIIDGILYSFVGLLASTALKFGLEVSWDFLSLGIAVAAFAALLLRVNIVLVVLGSALLALFGRF